MITVYYKVFNEADYLKESMESIYPYCDKIVMLEYCLPSMKMVIKPNRATKEGLSCDGTTEIIQEFYDPDKKIEHKKWGFVDFDENVVYQIMADTTELGEYAWVMDGDIVYPENLAKTIFKLSKIKKYDVMWIPEVVFVFDLDHVFPVWTTAHQRVYKKVSKMSYYFPTVYELHWMSSLDGKSTRWYTREEKIVFDDGVYFSKFFDQEKDFAFHYCYVRDTQRMLEKQLAQYYMIDMKWDNKGIREECSKYKDPLDWRLSSTFYFTENDPNYSSIARYSEQAWHQGHPESMKGNKWLDHVWDGEPNKITYDEARELVNVLEVF